MAASLALWIANFPWAAVLLSGGPPLIAGGIYGLLFLVLLADPPR